MLKYKLNFIFQIWKIDKYLYLHFIFILTFFFSELACGNCNYNKNSLRQKIVNNLEYFSKTGIKASLWNIKNTDFTKYRRCFKNVKRFNPYRCINCSRWASSLNNHIGIHTGEKPFVCEICLKFPLWKLIKYILVKNPMSVKFVRNPFLKISLCIIIRGNMLILIRIVSIK